MPDDHLPQPAILVVTRQQIEARDLSPVNTLFEEWNARLSGDDPEAIVSCLGCLTILVEGYDDEKRELHTVPEVRIWFALLEQDIKHVAFFLSPLHHNLHFFFSMKLRYTDTGQALASRAELRDMLVQTYGSMNDYCETFGLDQEGEAYVQHCSEIAQVLGAANRLEH